MALKCGVRNIVELSGTFYLTDKSIEEYYFPTIPYVGHTPNEIQLRIVENNKAVVVSIVGSTITMDKDHGLEAGDTVWVHSVGGMYTISGEQEVATVPSSKSLTLVSALPWADWTGGGTVRKLFFGPVDLEGGGVVQGNDVRTYTLPETLPFTPKGEYTLIMEMVPLSAVVADPESFHLYLESDQVADYP